ncbi:MAG: chemotaxis protein CheC [Lachnospiraceae bacterium]|nr:chemotaxis protein CheC [Lachnospiraceae bacterium]
MQDQKNVDGMDWDVLTEIANIGAGNAVTALSQMISNKIDMHVPKVNMLTFSELSEILGGPETLVAGIMVSLEDDIDGYMLFMLENESAHHLVSQIMGHPPMAEVPETFSEIEQSALMEIGNIITGAYLNSISKMTELNIKTSIPHIAIDMAGAILSVPAIEFGKLGDKALLIESRFRDMDIDISGYFIMIPTMESYHAILKALGIG